jgi:hypothetical protein
VTRFTQHRLAMKEEVDGLVLEVQPEKLTNDNEEFLRELVK